tara:strand:- start:17 stop:343 length:327 start_codon:yes stop_codon:yes gene_type:complete
LFLLPLHFLISENPPFSLSGIIRALHESKSPGFGGYIRQEMAITADNSMELRKSIRIQAISDYFRCSISFNFLLQSSVFSHSKPHVDLGYPAFPLSFGTGSGYLNPSL